MLKNLLAVVAGIVIGSIVNMSLVEIGMRIVPLPAGADVSSVEKIRESISLLKSLNFLFPFLAHAIGTLCGAFVAANIAANRPLMMAIWVSLFFLLGGIFMIVEVGGPLWFCVADLLLAYIPMGYLGYVLAKQFRVKAK